MLFRIGHGEINISDYTKDELDRLKKSLRIFAKDLNSPSGFICFNLFNYKDKTFPTGYLERVLTKLKKKGIEPALIDERIYPEKTLKIKTKNKPKEPRDWQVEAMTAITANNVGIIQGPTGTGKSYLITETIAHRQAPTLVIVPNVAIQKKLIDTFKNRFGSKYISKDYPRASEAFGSHPAAKYGHNVEKSNPKHIGYQSLYSSEEGNSQPRKSGYSEIFENNVLKPSSKSGYSLMSDDKDNTVNKSKKVYKLKRTELKKKDPYDKPIVVICFQALSDIAPGFLKKFEMVIVDEYHHSSAVSIRHALMKMPSAAYRYGFSATPWRDKKHEMLLLESTLGGNIVYNYDIQEAMDDKIIERPEYKQIPSGLPKVFLGKSRNWRNIVDNGLIGNEARNRQIAGIAKEEYEKGNNILICVDEIAHIEALVLEFKKYDIEPLIVHGQMRESLVEENIEKISNTKGALISIATMVIGEGADLVCVNRIILASGGKGSIRFIQRIGRSLRLKDGSGVKIFDFFDFWNPVLKKHSTARWVLFQTHYKKTEERPSQGFYKELFAEAKKEK